MAHHFVAPEEGFGVSNMFWDKIFRTEIKPK
jgi:sterol desaturase/sphingolipid hydroxylase (fatty acid hydroxylase superfamily)